MQRPQFSPRPQARLGRPRRDSPLLDLSDQSVKRLLKVAKPRGYVTYDELNSVLPAEEVSSEQIEDTMAMLSDMGINVVETEEGEEPAEPVEDTGSDEEERRARPQTMPTRSETRAEPAERTDDPVRMYLREMGSVELLSREGEIAIAKRIEAGREAMIAGLCESPLTFQAIIIWRDELNDGKILLRDIIDLEATYEGPEGKAPPALGDGGDRAAVGGEAEPAAARGRRDRRGRGVRERALARSHGGRAQAEGVRHLRPHCRHLQEAAPSAGPPPRAADGGRGRITPAAEGLRQAPRGDHRGRQEPRSTTTVSRAWSSSSTRSTSASSASRGG